MPNQRIKFIAFAVFMVSLESPCIYMLFSRYSNCNLLSTNFAFVNYQNGQSSTNSLLQVC